MEPNQTHETIAGQVDHMRPAHLKPGVDVLMEVMTDKTLRVLVKPTRRLVDIRYDEGPDLYTVTPYDIVDGNRAIALEPLTGIFCDQLGELVFGSDAEPWTEAFGYILTDEGVTRF